MIIKLAKIVIRLVEVIIIRLDPYLSLNSNNLIFKYNPALL